MEVKTPASTFKSKNGVRRPHIKSIPYEEWNDNASLEKIVDELHEGGVNVVTGSLDQLINWGRSNSLWSLTFATSCCGIEFMACGCARYDFARFGFEVTRNSPRQADLIMCAGTITHKMAPALKRLYDEMAEPKYVIAVGGCAISGGPFKSSYHVVKGIEEIVPVDVFIPGCPPRPEAIMYGMMQLQRKVKIEKFFGGANHKQTAEEKALGVSNEELTFRSKHNDHRREPIVVTDVPQEFVNEMKTASKQEQNDACISSAEREQVRPEVKAASKQEQNDACISSAEREQVRPEVKAATESQPTVKEEGKA